MERQYTASAYVVNFEDRTILLMYNRKLDKWLQPGGHIESSETPEEAAIREVKEETGIDIQIISRDEFNNNPIPISIERYINKVGDMIDIQYLAIPINTVLSSNENNQFGWFSEKDLEKINVGEDIKIKVKKILKNRFKNEGSNF